MESSEVVVRTLVNGAVVASRTVTAASVKREEQDKVEAVKIVDFVEREI